MKSIIVIVLVIFSLHITKLLSRSKIAHINRNQGNKQSRINFNTFADSNFQDFIIRCNYKLSP